MAVAIFNPLSQLRVHTWNTILIIINPIPSILSILYWILGISHVDIYVGGTSGYLTMKVLEGVALNG